MRGVYGNGSNVGSHGCYGEWPIISRFSKPDPIHRTSSEFFTSRRDITSQNHCGARSSFSDVRTYQFWPQVILFSVGVNGSRANAKHTKFLGTPSGYSANRMS